MRAAGFVISEEGEFEIVENPFIWQLLKRRRRKCVGKIKINLMDMCCENEMGLAHSICMEMCCENEMGLAHSTCMDMCCENEMGLAHSICMDMCCENEMGLAHSICMEMSGSITREMDIQFLHAVSCCTLLLVL